MFASFAPKRYAMEFARREATKRGFPPGTTRTVQVLTDGDPDLACYVRELFPDAIHTLDVMHVIEKLWNAGTAVHKEGTDEHRAWAEAQKDALYGGRVEDIIAELDERLATTPKTGPGNKFRRTKLSSTRNYIAKRAAMMNYDELIARDLELGTGAVEGAIKHIIGRRLDNEGMRWIKERADAVLQLRCIEVNGDWEAFVARGINARARDTLPAPAASTRPATPRERAGRLTRDALHPTQKLTVIVWPPVRSTSSTPWTRSRIEKSVVFKRSVPAPVSMWNGRQALGVVGRAASVKSRTNARASGVLSSGMISRMNHSPYVSRLAKRSTNDSSVTSRPIQMTCPASQSWSGAPGVQTTSQVVGALMVGSTVTVTSAGVLRSMTFQPIAAMSNVSSTVPISERGDQSSNGHGPSTLA